MDDNGIRRLVQDLFDAKIARLEDKFEERFRGMDKATTQLGLENERRFQELNALRKEYTEDRTEDQKKMVTWDTYNPKVDELQRHIGVLTNEVGKIVTSAKNWLITLGIFFTILQLALQLWHK